MGSLHLCNCGFSFAFFPNGAIAGQKTVPTIRIDIPEAPSRDDAGSLVPDDALKDVETPAISEPDLPPETISNEEDTEQVKPEVFYGDDSLPSPVKHMREQLLKAARSGDLEALRPIFQSLKEPPIVSLDADMDAIEFLKTTSGDGSGIETLAILIEVLESGYVHRDSGKDGEIYIWPYFVEVPLESLNPKQMVELFRLITAGDFDDMQDYGTYIFYRAGITPDGELKFFIAGD